MIGTANQIQSGAEERARIISFGRKRVAISYSGDSTVSNFRNHGAFNFFDARVDDRNFPTQKHGIEVVECCLWRLPHGKADHEEIESTLRSVGQRDAMPAELLAYFASEGAFRLGQRIDVMARAQWFVTPSGVRHCVNVRLSSEERSVGVADADRPGPRTLLLSTRKGYRLALI